MRDHRRLGAALGILLLIGASAAADDAVPMHAGDRVTGDLPAGWTEAGLVFEALAGTRFTCKAKATGGGELEPEILLYDAEDREIDLRSRYRHTAGSGKARVRTLELPVTGRYLLVIRAMGESHGTYRLRLGLTHPRKLQEDGRLATTWSTGQIRVPALEGSSARVKIKGLEGLLPSVEEVLAPGLRELAPPTVEEDGPVTRVTMASCPETGDYRLVIGGREDTWGRWKGKVKLTHPVPERSEPIADGRPAGTFTSGKKPAEHPELPGIPEPITSWRIIAQGSDSNWTMTYGKIVKTQAEWVSIWNQHRPTAPPPIVDFTKEMVVAIFLGSRPAGAYAEIVSATFVPYGPMLYTLDVVFYSSVNIWTQPSGPDRPYLIVAMRRFEGPVRLLARVP